MIPKWITVIGGAGIVAFGAIQFIRPAIANPPVTADAAAPREVKQILKTSCYDCHSNETKLAWFDQIVPGYWIVARDVRRGRRRLNFSELGLLPAAQQKGVLWEAVNQIRLGAMPLRDYALLHRDAVVTPAELTVLKEYLNPPAPPTAASQSDLSADNAQFEKWVRDGGSTDSVAPVPNGIEFLPDYKNWKPISATDRFDNHTLRVILGNPIAVKAIAENHINPWPDGAAFAKVAWSARDDGQGHLHAGSFIQVEFMMRDRAQYAATKGWGWGRWRGLGLTPYGKNAKFTEECVGCHLPVHGSDYVYTMPFRRQLNGTLPQNPLEWNAITTFADVPARTIGILYGNDTAVRAARSGAGNYPAGSVLALVTWNEREDDRWFGARIPGAVKSVEFVTVGAGNEYQKFEGSPLRQTSAATADPAAYLLSLRAAVMP